jgi:hypothetical protein
MDKQGRRVPTPPVGPHQAVELVFQHLAWRVFTAANPTVQRTASLAIATTHSLFQLEKKLYQDYV